MLLLSFQNLFDVTYKYSVFIKNQVHPILDAFLVKEKIMFPNAVSFNHLMTTSSKQ